MAFATVADLEARLGRPFDVDDVSFRQASAALDDATELIRSTAGGQQIFPSTTEVVTLIGNGRDVLQLPQVPVTAVTQVTVTTPPVATATLPTNSYAWTADGALYRVGGGPWAGGWYGGRFWHGLVAVSYTHGFSAVPAVLQGLCARLAVESVMGRQAGIRSETVGGYAVTYSKAANTVLSDDDTRMIREFMPVYVP